MRVAFITLLALLVPARAAAAEVAETRMAPVLGWMVLPFVVLLLAIAVAPFIDRHWWEKYYPHVSLGLGFSVFAYYVVRADYHRMLETLADYLSFIALIGSLFVAAGGIFLHTERQANPLGNTVPLPAGALISNGLGTTGAPMPLVPPFLRINRPRVRP